MILANRPRRSLLLAGCLIILIFTGCGGAPTSSRASATPTLASTATAAAPYSHLLTPTYPVTMRSDVAYGSAPLEQLDLCQPDGVTSSQLPGIVLVHGGSSTVGDKRTQFDIQGDTLVDLCMSLASQGFVVASINYRLAHANPWPAQVEDAQLAVRWLRAHAHELGIDARHLCSVGLSSGAYLAVILGAFTKTLAGDRASQYADQSSQVACVADFYGPVDLAAWIKTSPDNQAEVLDLLSQATPQTNPALYREASPLYAITSASAPMLIVQGTSDTEVPEAQSRALEQALKRNHVAVQYISYDGGHVFEGLDAAQEQEIWRQAVVYLKQDA